MSQRKLRRHMRGILENIDAAESFIGEMNFGDFLHDLKTNYAVQTALEIISEAVVRIPAEIKDRHVDVPWRDIGELANVYRHFYEVVIPERVWNALHTFLPDLREVVENELAALET